MLLNRDAKGETVKNPYYKSWLLAAVVVLAPSISSAIGLGKLTVLSRMGQPLMAEIDLVSAQKDEISTLSASLASLEAYRGSQLQYNAALTELSFQLAKRPDGQSYLKLSSRQGVSDPFVDLLVELKWASGSLLRQYSALIDPLDYVPTLAQVPAAAVVAVASPLPAATVTTPVMLTVAQPQKAPPASADYGPIKRGETLSKIAVKLKPQGVSVEQMMVGIFRNNPQAFIKNNMNRIKADEMLNIPEMAQLIALSRSDAIMEVRLRLANPSRARQTVTANAAVVRSRQKASTSQEQAAGKSVLRLSSGE